MSVTQKSSTPLPAYLLLGSNIEPEINILKALNLLSNKMRIAITSSIYESNSITKNENNFLNCIIKIETKLSIHRIKHSIISVIEHQLGRVRTDDKNAPRTIDIDILIYGEKQIDFEICERVYMAVPLAEIYPNYICVNTDEPIKNIADRLKKYHYIKLRTDLKP